MGRTALLACPEGGTSLSAMAGLDRSSFNTEPGLRSISFSLLCFCAVCCVQAAFFVVVTQKRPPHSICAVAFLSLARPLKTPAACALGIFSGIIILDLAFAAANRPLQMHSLKIRGGITPVPAQGRGSAFPRSALLRGTSGQTHAARRGQG